MIQIQSREQFQRAEERARKERMMVRRQAPRTFSVTNRAKGRSYTVTFHTLEGRLFGSCSCEAGTPMRGNHVPKVCKHLYAALVMLRALTGKVQGSH
jgi:hypothetical protein